ncbi:hypothetical protein LT493_17165 [Streptomyces tricolor]|nr:hypothetical protein [Streptomyces tricolor]
MEERWTSPRPVPAKSWSGGVRRCSWHRRALVERAAGPSRTLVLGHEGLGTVERIGAGGLAAPTASLSGRRHRDVGVLDPPAVPAYYVS